MVQACWLLNLVVVSTYCPASCGMMIRSSNVHHVQTITCTNWHNCFNDFVVFSPTTKQVFSTSQAANYVRFMRLAWR